MAKSGLAQPQNLVISSLLAFFSYVPFEYVAKTSLIVAVILFVVDPIPPVTRLLALGMTLVVSLLARLERHWREHQNQQQEEEEEENEQRDSLDSQQDNKKATTALPEAKKDH